MSTSLDNAAPGLSRPYTLGTFQKRLHDFEDLIRELTLKDIEATPDERRQLITGRLNTVNQTYNLEFYVFKL